MAVNLNLVCVYQRSVFRRCFHRRLWANGMMCKLKKKIVNIIDYLNSFLYSILFLRYKNTKKIMLFANSWQVVGSFMYFTGVSSHFLIFGRLICGVGMYIFKKIVLIW
jgi:hypothetical protein